TGVGRGFLDRSDRGGRFVGCDGGTEPAVGQATDSVKRGRTLAAEPQLERRLHGLRPHRDAGKVPSEALVLMRDGLARPPTAQERYDLVEIGTPVSPTDSQRGPLSRLVETGHDTEQH